MNKSYNNKLCEAITFRKKAMLPKIKPIIISGIIFTFTYIVIAILFAPFFKPEYHFESERGWITALSAIYLAMACAFSIAALIVNNKLEAVHKRLWLIMILGLGFFALDELLRFHEYFGSIIKQYFDSGIFRNWNDVIVISYGIIALPLFAILLPSIIRYRMLLELFVIAFIFYVIHTAIDSTQQPETAISIILEESAKLFCGLFLVLSAYVGFLGVLWNTELPAKLKSD